MIHNGLQRFTYHNKKNICYFFVIEHVNRCELIEIYCLAHMNRKKTELSQTTKPIFAFLP